MSCQGEELLTASPLDLNKAFVPGFALARVMGMVHSVAHWMYHAVGPIAACDTSTSVARRQLENNTSFKPQEH